MMNNRSRSLLINTDGAIPYRRGSPPTASSTTASGTITSPAVVVTPPGTMLKDKPAHAHSYSHSSSQRHSHSSSSHSPLSQSHNSEGAAAENDGGSLPTDYLTDILSYHLLFRALAGIIYLAGLLEWYTYHRMASLLAYWTYWITAYYAAMNALREENGRHVTAFFLALLSHALEAFVLINIVYNPEVWGSAKLRYLVLPVSFYSCACAWNMCATGGAKSGRCSDTWRDSSVQNSI